MSQSKCDTKANPLRERLWNKVPRAWIVRLRRHNLSPSWDSPHIRFLDNDRTCPRSCWQKSSQPMCAKDAAMPAETGDREVAIREIFKHVLASYTLATTCYEIFAHDRDPEFPDLIKRFRGVQNRAAGAYRDIFCADEWRHDRKQAIRAVGRTLSTAGVEVTDAVCAGVVEAVMQSMPGAVNYQGTGR